MLKSIVLQITLIAIVLFIVVNYFISSRHDKDVINNIIMKKSESLTEDQIYEMEQMKSNYLKQKFRIYITRSIVFGISLFFAISYLTPEQLSARKTIMRREMLMILYVMSSWVVLYHYHLALM